MSDSEFLFNSNQGAPSTVSVQSQGQGDVNAKFSLKEEEDDDKDAEDAEGALSFVTLRNGPSAIFNATRS
eukprot:CAMPEP_0114400272 /NCGR_PEP_ID=MMETSP0102-20121206/16276_1 /TAXON_ID=38822 ORGANISM="Pteridomonas danica, Strain PT" /NCGR_SAMPLE_ID=MMETSP0102 /ASSEMBLY_ACC=CAM_ASM_000212 /LENGTH=69 /DNA_ID=CAMNT_0001562573 /DNA_START=327 /DNA_END=536 /DNA_ORIENTATION=-